MTSSLTKHEITCGRKFNGKLGRTYFVGNAYLEAGQEYYTVKFMFLPGQTYFLAKNREGMDYTLYAKVIEDSNGVKFQNPVGAGRLSYDIEMHLEIYIPLLRTQLFLCLLPSND